MAVKDVFKVSRKTFFNPRAWLGFDLLVSQFQTTWALVRGLFTVDAPARTETFEEAMKRLNVDEAAVQESSKNYLFYSVAFFLLGAAAFIYAFYLLILYTTFTGWLLGLAVSALFLAQAFRFNFWHFQIKYRKLGCTFAEWWRGKPFADGERKP